MNREIKFRAWDKEQHVMVYDIAVYDGGGHIGFSINTALKHYGDKAENLDCGDGNGWLWVMSNFHLMQYCGLKDKHGVDIYEGDLFKDETGDFSHLLCEWDSKGCCFAINGYGKEEFSGQSYIEQHALLLSNSEEIEIIGNIHSNPELLTK